MANLALTDQQFFILTPAGERLLESSTGQAAAVLTPWWDVDRRQLWYGGQLVKWFRVLAECQKLILSAFQEDGWIRRIDDPLPRRPNHDPKERLHDSVRRLNEAQKAPLLIIERDGMGQGVT